MTFGISVQEYLAFVAIDRGSQYIQIASCSAVAEILVNKTLREFPISK